jgi:hypothetical protein
LHLFSVKLTFLRFRILVVAWALSAARAEVQIERTIMPLDAAPSSFAIGLPGGVSFCFDPVNANLRYAWTGGFIDIAPVRPGMGKKISEVSLLGPMAYLDRNANPLRLGKPPHVPAIEFRGYTLADDAVEFRYTIDGVPVREEIRVRADGRALTRRFRVDPAGDRTWSWVLDNPAVTVARQSADELVLDLALAPAASTPIPTP